METASGVYLHIYDNSFEAINGASSVKPIIPMLTTKGKLGLNMVTARTARDILGYDLEYNSNYYGLERILETVSYAMVWRLNQNAKLGNAYFADASSTKAFNNDAETVEDIFNTDPKPLFAVANKDVGNWQTTAIKLKPTYTVGSVANTNPTSTTTQIIEYDDVSSTEKFTIGETEVEGGILFYNSSNSDVVGIVKKNVENNFKAYKVVDGVVIDDVVEEGAIVTDKSVGTVTFTDNAITITLTAPFSKDSFYTVRTLPSTIKDWTLVQSSYDGRNYNVQKEFEFSTDSESEMYIDNVDFGDLAVQVTGAIGSLEAIRSYFTLEGGSNGDNTISPIDVDTTILDTCGCNLMPMNGLTDYNLINRIATRAQTNKIHMFVDAPAYAQYIDLEQWASHIARNEYVSICARPDKIKISEKKSIYLYPSVNYIINYAKMLNNYGSLNFPPAGKTYGVVDASDLIECDYELYADELKTNRINWQRVYAKTPCIWEQRTTYALDTDLSYIAPVFIVDAVCADLKTFEMNFNFRYSNPTDILNQDSGLKKILDGYIENGFLYAYTLNMPTYEEAQKAGRTLDIPITITVTKDAEVININVTLVNA